MSATIATLYDLAARHGFSPAAAAVALDAPHRGGGRAQVGTRGGRALRDRVAALFDDLAGLGARPAAEPLGSAATQGNTMEPMKPMQPMAPMKPMEASSLDAPADWGQPSSSGGQNDVRYAYFDRPHRLVVESNGRRTTYDTAGHRITGVSQSQSDAATGRMVFTTADGTVDVSSLKTV